MFFREAVPADIKQMQVVRHAVKENRLSDPSLVPDTDVQDYITRRGKGWVCTIDNVVVGFSIADLQDKNVWALFVDPEHEQKGIGKQLQKLMLDWYFSQTDETIWLGTWPETRADHFYKKSGWTDKGIMKNGERRFEMKKEDWLNKNS